MTAQDAVDWYVTTHPDPVAGSEAVNAPAAAQTQHLELDNVALLREDEGEEMGGGSLLTGDYDEL